MVKLLTKRHQGFDKAHWRLYIADDFLHPCLSRFSKKRLVVSGNVKIFSMWTLWVREIPNILPNWSLCIRNSTTLFPKVNFFFFGASAKFKTLFYFIGLSNLFSSSTHLLINWFLKSSTFSSILSKKSATSEEAGFEVAMLYRFSLSSGIKWIAIFFENLNEISNFFAIDFNSVRLQFCRNILQVP